MYYSVMIFLHFSNFIFYAWFYSVLVFTQPNCIFRKLFLKIKCDPKYIYFSGYLN